MTEADAKKLLPGDRVIITTSDGIGQATWGTILTVVGLNSDGILISNNVTITDVRRVDLYRSVPRPKAVKP
jgi:hypothetical protein